MTEQYKTEVGRIIQSDMNDIAFFMETSKGFPHDMSFKMMTENKTLLDQLLICVGFRDRYPKIFTIQGMPYLELNQKYFGVMPKISRDEFAKKYYDK